MGNAPARGSLLVGGIRVSYLDWSGTGSRCLLLHGITSNARTWWRLAPELVTAGLHTVALDMPGHGESGESTDHRIEALADLVAGVIRQLEFAPVTVVGHSWGGAVALALSVLKHADLVDRVVLMDPALTMSADVGRNNVAAFSRGLGATMEANFSVLRAQNPDWDDQDIHWKAEALLQCRADAVEGFFTKSGDWNLTPRLAAVKVPLLLLVADPAATILSTTTRTIAEQALVRPIGRMIVVPETSHDMYRGAGFAPTRAALMRWLQV